MPHVPFNLLVFDTSTERLAVGLQAPAGSFSIVEAGGALASRTLLPQIHALLERGGIGLQALDFIAFGQGPGAFTGLRTACAVAQGLGLGLGLPLLAIDSLLIVADDGREQVGPQAARLDVAVVMDARMDEAYAAVYRWDDGRWQVVQPPALLTLPALAEAWSALAVDVVAGSGLAAFGERLPLPAAAQRLPDEADRAAALLRLAGAAAAVGAGIDAALALPLYLRDKVALTTRERDAVRASAAAAVAAAPG